MFSACWTLKLLGKLELVEMMPALAADLKRVARTDRHVAMYISNGHGAWEAALSNVIAPGDRVLVLATGRFGHGWAEMATGLGAEVDILDFGRNAPVDLVFQSIAGTQKANESFGITQAMLAEAEDAAKGLKRGTVGNNVMYFETGQGAALSADAHEGIDQQTVEARAYAVARKYSPLLVNTVVGFIGPEYLFDGKQITRAGLEDHFCGKLLGVPMGCDVCYTNHAEADQDDMDNLLTLLGVAGCNFIMGIPGSDDIMLNYQTTSFHDALYIRRVLGSQPAPEFRDWLTRMQIMSDAERAVLADRLPEAFARSLKSLPPASGQH